VAPALVRILRKRRDDNDRQHTTIKQNTVEVGGDGDPNGKWGKEEEERTTIEG
jgi:hypothetical protein